MHQRVKSVKIFFICYLCVKLYLINLNYLSVSRTWLCLNLVCGNDHIIDSERVCHMLQIKSSYALIMQEMLSKNLQLGNRGVYSRPSVLKQRSIIVYCYQTWFKSSGMSLVSVCSQTPSGMFHSLTHRMHAHNWIDTFSTCPCVWRPPSEFNLDLNLRQ